MQFMNRNPFLVTRFVLLSLIAWLSIFTLVFASFNVASTTRTSELPVPGAAGFLIFTSSATLVMLLINGVAWRVAPYSKVVRVNFECGWTGFLSILQLTATLLMTFNLPVMCRYQSTNVINGECVSSSVLAPFTWFSSFTLITYVLMLSATTITHAPSRPGIWSSTVHSVPWFVRYQIPQVVAESQAPRSMPPRRPQNADDSDEFKSVDLEAGVSDKNTPLDVKDYQGRRGIDAPFATTGEPAARLPRATRYFQLSWYAKAASALSLFPREVADQNEPIPKPPRISEWLRANESIHSRSP